MRVPGARVPQRQRGRLENTKNYALLQTPCYTLRPKKKRLCCTMSDRLRGREERRGAVRRRGVRGARDGVAGQHARPVRGGAARRRPRVEEGLNPHARLSEGKSGSASTALLRF